MHFLITLWKFSWAYIKKIFRRSDLGSKISHVLASCAAWNVFSLNLLLAISRPNLRQEPIKLILWNWQNMEKTPGSAVLQASVGKVHIFWEGHKILWNLHRRFDRYYIGQIYCGDFAKICGLLRIYEFYFFKLFTVDNTLHNKDKWLIIPGKSYSNMRSSHNDDKSFVKQNSYHRIARTNLKRSLDKYHYSIKIQTREAQNQHQLKSPNLEITFIQIGPGHTVIEQNTKSK